MYWTNHLHQLVSKWLVVLFKDGVILGAQYLSLFLVHWILSSRRARSGLLSGKKNTVGFYAYSPSKPHDYSVHEFIRPAFRWSMTEDDGHSLAESCPLNCLVPFIWWMLWWSLTCGTSTSYFVPTCIVSSPLPLIQISLFQIFQYFSFQAH